MISKYLESKIQVNQDEEMKSFDSGIELEYYLIESESDSYEILSGNYVYGIEVVKRNNEKSMESEIIRNLSYCRESTQSILIMLAKNKVTPTELTFILDDLIGQ